MGPNFEQESVWGELVAGTTVLRSLGIKLEEKLRLKKYNIGLGSSSLVTYFTGVIITYPDILLFTSFVKIRLQ